jgi:peptide deformylase
VWTDNALSIAAPQIGSNLSLFIIVNILNYNRTYRRYRSFEVIINPLVLEKSPDVEGAWEGCLSFPEVECFVERSKEVKVQYYNLLGQRKVVGYVDLVARVRSRQIFQHEIDHLNGIVMAQVAQHTRPISYRSPKNAFLKA